MKTIIQQYKSYYDQCSTHAEFVNLYKNKLLDPQDTADELGLGSDKPYLDMPDLEIYYGRDHLYYEREVGSKDTPETVEPFKEEWHFEDCRTFWEERMGYELDEWFREKPEFYSEPYNIIFKKDLEKFENNGFKPSWEVT